MVDVYSGFEGRLERVHDTLGIIEKSMLTGKERCAYIVDLSDCLNQIKAISTSIMTISDILGTRESGKANLLIDRCKVLTKRIQDMCIWAYEKDLKTKNANEVDNNDNNDNSDSSDI